ncbi:MAG: hypothetical protein V4738_05880 [Pseudomonadota bacterium]
MHNTTHLTTDTGDALAQRVNNASTALHHKIDNLATPAHGVIDGAATGAHQTVDKLAQTLNRGASTVGQQVQRIVDAPTELADAACGAIQKHPLRAVAISLAVGLVLGRLSASR